MNDNQAIEFVNPSEIEKTNNNELITVDDSILLIWSNMQYDEDHSDSYFEKLTGKKGLLMT